MDLDQKDFVNHFLIIYENSFGNRYDTYIITKFKLNQPLFEPLLNPIPGPIRIHVIKKEIMNFFKYEDSNRTTKIYTKREKRKFDKTMKKALKQSN